MFGYKFPDMKLTFDAYQVQDNIYVCIPAEEWEVIRNDGRSLILRNRKAPQGDEGKCKCIRGPGAIIGIDNPEQPICPDCKLPLCMTDATQGRTKS